MKTERRQIHSNEVDCVLMCLNNALSLLYVYQTHIMVYIMAGMPFMLGLSVGIYGMENSIQFSEGMKGYSLLRLKLLN